MKEQEQEIIEDELRLLIEKTLKLEDELNLLVKVKD